MKWIILIISIFIAYRCHVWLETHDSDGNRRKPDE